MKSKTWICHIHNYLHKHLHCIRHYKKSMDSLGLPRWHSCKEPACQSRRCRRCSFDPWARKISWNRKWQPTSVFLPGESYGQRGLVGYSPWGSHYLWLMSISKVGKVPCLVIFFFNCMIITDIASERNFLFFCCRYFALQMLNKSASPSVVSAPLPHGL